MTDLTSRLRTAIEARLQVAEVASTAHDVSVYGGTLVDDRHVRAHWDANPPDVVARACEADLRVLDRHRPKQADSVLDYEVCSWCGCRDDEVSFPCPDVGDLATRFGVPVGDIEDQEKTND